MITCDVHALMYRNMCLFITSCTVAEWVVFNSVDCLFVAYFVKMITLDPFEISSWNFYVTILHSDTLWHMDGDSTFDQDYTLYVLYYLCVKSVSLHTHSTLLCNSFSHTV